MPYTDTQGPELDWINLQNEMKESTNQEESKLQRKFKENPFVPLGCLTTATVLILGLRTFIKGNRSLSQKFMRYRVLAQGTTIAALMLGIFAAGKSG